MPITNLIYTDTFKTWFDTTNSLINSVNGITVYNILAGDGIGITSANNIFTISHGSSVATGVTFSGNVKFNGSVSFASSPSISSTTVNVAPKVNGITSGNVVRMTSSGLTLAKADSATNAEVLGIVVSEDSSSYNVAINGAINNTGFVNTIPNALGIAGGTLIAGQAYFLNPFVAGGITVNEPQTYGYVTKPILLGISGNVGSLIPYRGIQIEGISAGITAELDNKVIVEIDYASSDFKAASAAIAIGDPVLYYDDSATGYNEFLTTFVSVNFVKSKGNGKLNGSTYNIAAIPDIVAISESLGLLTGKNFLGLISKIINDDTVNQKIILEVTLPGGSFTADPSNLSGFISAAGLASTNNTANLGLTPMDLLNVGQDNIFAHAIKINANTIKIILVGTSGGRSTSTKSAPARVAIGATGSLEYDNLIPNGTFSIWQRQTTSLTAGSVNDYSTPFADRWFITNKYNTNGLTLDVSRQAFDSDQTNVPGSPLYYVNAKAEYLSIMGPENRIRLENIQTNARLLQNQEATISFWAKSTVSGATVDIFYNRYADNYSSSALVESTLESRTIVTPAGISLTSGWSEYKYTFVPSVAGFTLGATASGWFGVGFEFPNSTATISLSQVQLELGTSVSDLVYVDPQQELQRCKPYYLRTYDWDQPNGFVGTSTLNEYNLQLGNLVTQKNYIVKFPVKLVKNPSVVLYSPNTGQSGDAFNVNTGVDMRYSGADYKTNLPWDMNTSRTSAAWPTPNITVPSLSRNGMTVNVSNGATHLDTLQFHYVADADINLNV